MVTEVDAHIRGIAPVHESNEAGIADDGTFHGLPGEDIVFADSRRYTAAAPRADAIRRLAVGLPKKLRPCGSLLVPLSRLPETP
jgi:hypothetical protein